MSTFTNFADIDPAVLEKEWRDDLKTLQNELQTDIQKMESALKEKRRAAGGGSAAHLQSSNSQNSQSSNNQDARDLAEAEQVAAAYKRSALDDLPELLGFPTNWEQHLVPEIRDEDVNLPTP